MLAAASLLVSAWQAPAPLRGVSSPLRSASLVRMDVTSEYLASTEDASLEVGAPMLTPRPAAHAHTTACRHRPARLPPPPCRRECRQTHLRARRHQAEFASVKAIAQVAQVMAPVVTAPAPPKKRRKRDVVTGAFKGVVMWVRMAGAVREEAINIIDDSCDVDEPEICTDGEARKGAIRQLSASIFKTARYYLPSPLATYYLLPAAYYC